MQRWGENVTFVPPPLGVLILTSVMMVLYGLGRGGVRDCRCPDLVEELLADDLLIGLPISFLNGSWPATSSQITHLWTSDL